MLEERGGEGFPFLEGEDDCFGGRGGIFFFFGRETSVGFGGVCNFIILSRLPWTVVKCK